jgi:exportin-1
LQILEKLITTRWKTLPDGQQQGGPLFLRPSHSVSSTNVLLLIGIRNFIVGVNVKVASDEVAMRKEKTYVNKLNLALVQVDLRPILISHRR